MARISEAELAAAYGLSPAEFEQVIDTVLGEARGEGFIGMAAVAKAMDNRANVRGQSIYDVVTAPNQFDGAAFQSGKKDAQAREVAIEALAAVAMGEDPAQVGTSDHFATNETKTGWTQAFSDTAKTVGGHTFYSSPEALELGEYLSVAATPQAKPDMAMQTAQISIDNQGMPGVGIPNLSAMNAQPVSVVDPFAAVMNEPDARGRANQATTATGAPFGRPDQDYVQTQELAYLGDLDGLFDYGLQNQESRTVDGRTYDRSYFDINNMDPTTARSAALAFAQVGVSPSINSSYRGQGYNEAVGGVKNSQHKEGRAFDIARAGMTMDQQVAMLDSLIEQGFQGFGIGRNFIHADTRKNGPAIWDYNNPIPAELLGVYNDRMQKDGTLGRYPSDYAFIGTPQAKPDGFISANDLPGSPSRELSNYASFVGNNDALGRGTAPGRSYVDVDLDAFSVTDPFSQAVDRAAETRGGIGATPATAYGPSFGATDFAAAPAVTARDSMIDGYQEYAQSRGSGLAPLEAPQEIGVRAAEPAYTIDSIPGLDWATNQNNGPSLGTQATVATAPTSNVATPQGNQQQGGGPFGGFFDGGIGKGVKDTAMATAIGGPIAGGVVALDSVFGDGLSKDKDKDQEAKGRNAFGRARDAVSDFRGTTIGSGLTGVALGSNFGPGGALIGGALGLGRGFARNGMPGFGNLALGNIGNLGNNPSVGHAALGYAMNQARANPNYTGIDFSRDFTNMGGRISNGRPAPGQVTAAEFNAAQRGAGKAIGVMEGFSRDLGEAFGKSKDSENESEGKGGGCFLTTAAVDVLGEADNGDTLQTLRWFRDNIMRARPDWSADVDEYYRIAPAIVERLNNDEATYRDLMDKHIRPAVRAIKAGEYEKAYRVYRAMVEDLEGAE
jgi:hypothetical protein